MDGSGMSSRSLRMRLTRRRGGAEGGDAEKTDRADPQVWGNLPGEAKKTRYEKAMAKST